MTRTEILTRFRQENPEITLRVATDAVLESWCEVGDLEICTRVRLIKGSASFAAAVGVDTYNLPSKITKFYDIDELPGGGVAFNNKRLTLRTKAYLDANRSNWRIAGNGTPKDYFRRKGDLILGQKANATNTIDIDTVLIADPFDDDSKTPFNQLSYLEPFHYSLVLYLKMRVFAGKVKKPEMAAAALGEWEKYIKWMKEEVDRGTYEAIQLRPPTGYRGVSRHWYR